MNRIVRLTRGLRTVLLTTGLATGLATSLAMALAAGSTSTPALAADIESGRKLAEETCARCHDVGPDGAFKQYPPSFAAIAVFRSADDIRARIIYPPLHSNMPQMGIIWAPDVINDLVAYIVSLEKPQP